MSSSVLDNPLWHALTTRQGYLARGGGMARRFDADIAPFAAIADGTREAERELKTIALEKGLYLLGVLPSKECGLELSPPVAVLQMTCEQPPSDRVPVSKVEILDNRHADEMRELTTIAFPTFFRPRTHEMGVYLGIREEGRLVAMAGERMRLEGYREISGVCTRSELRGRGYARQLVGELVRRIQTDGEIPFLHVDEDNAPAMAVYRALGFVPRRLLSYLLVRPLENRASSEKG